MDMEEGMTRDLRLNRWTVLIVTGVLTVFTLFMTAPNFGLDFSQALGTVIFSHLVGVIGGFILLLCYIWSHSTTGFVTCLIQLLLVVVVTFLTIQPFAADSRLLLPQLIFFVSQIALLLFWDWVFFNLALPPASQQVEYPD